MKKITFTLLAAFSLWGSVFSQPVASIQAPQYDGSNSSLSTPSGSVDAVYHRSCWLVLASELQSFALTNSVVTSFGLNFTQGVNAATSGQYTVYLQNTPSTTYGLGTNWSTIISSFPAGPNYVGVLNLPVTNGFTTVTLPLTNNFTYSGGGIYVALEWYAPTANATQWARCQANTTGLPTTGGVRGIAPAAGPAPTTLSTTAFRPSFTFNAANTATNEISIERVSALGQVSKLAQLGEVYTAVLRNNSSVAVNNVSVGLLVTGANPTAMVTGTASIPSGSFAVVSFPPFSSTVNGQNVLTFSISPDQNNTNNSATTSQSVSCFNVAVTPAAPAASFATLCYGAGAGGGIVALRYMSGTAPSSVVSVSGVAPSFTNAGNAGNSLYAVVCDATGSIIAQGLPVTLNAGNMDVFTAYKLTSPVALSPNTVYYLGLASTTSTNYPYGTIAANDVVLGHYRIPLAGGTPVQTDYEYLGMYGTLTFSNTTINVSATNTVVCKSSPITVTITASGADTYQWSQGTFGSAGTVTWAPNVAGNAALVTVSVTGNYTTGTASGCKSAVQAISFSLAPCLGINENTGADAVKVFPNPTVAGKTTVNNLNGVNTITVFNTIGQVVFTQTTSTETATIDISSYPAGNYLVKITDSNNETRTIKLINQN